MCNSYHNGEAMQSVCREPSVCSGHMLERLRIPGRMWLSDIRMNCFRKTCF